MIVKTGANYQNDGGYIEASREKDGTFIIKYEDKIGEIPSLDGVVDTMVTAKVSIDDTVTGTHIMYAVDLSGKCITVFTIPTSGVNVGVFRKAGSTLRFSQSPILKDGSADCEIVPYGADYQLKITGDNPIAVIGY